MFRVEVPLAAPEPAPLDPKNVQGDILVGLPKKTQTYYFFHIDSARVHDFRVQLGKLLPLITTTTQATENWNQIAQHKAQSLPGLLEMSGVNIAFSRNGLKTMGINDEIGDKPFDDGMLADAFNLGDKGTTTGTNFTPDWVPAFKGGDIDGLILVSGDSHATVALKLAEIKKIFFVDAHNATIHKVISIVGDVRPGAEAGHEHFGFNDGLSQPAVKDFDTKPNAGQQLVSQGVILLGREGDAPSAPNVGITRPPWALDGSLLAFRYLFQLVPEFSNFLTENPIAVNGIPLPNGSDLLGARLVGRWKSGAPIDLTPTEDNLTIANDKNQNNNFQYDFPGDQQTQDRCPFAAHTRKTNPRADLESLAKGSTEPHRIIRRGIQFGPEVQPEENKIGKTIFGRGLLFAAYQSNIVNGFQFIQESWANKTNFPPAKTEVPLPGFDPIIGQDKTGGERSLVGTNPSKQDAPPLRLPTEWVVPKGGEYFFSPSIPALQKTFALSA